MKTPRNKGKIAIGTGTIVVLVGLAILALTADAQVGRAQVRMVAKAPAAASPSGSPTLLYMNITGVPGESMEKGHVGWIDIASFDHGLEAAAPSTSGAGGGALRPVVQNFTVTKSLDKASPKLAQAVATGAFLQQVQFHVVRSTPAGTRLAYAYTLHDAVVARCHLSAATGGQAPTEEVSFIFRAVEAVYTEYDAGGVVKGTTTYMYKQ